MWYNRPGSHISTQFLVPYICVHIYNMNKSRIYALFYYKTFYYKIVDAPLAYNKDGPETLLAGYLISGWLFMPAFRQITG